MIRLERTEQEVNDQLHLAFDQIDAGTTKWPGMTYEQGVEAGIRWVIGEEEHPPMDD